MPMPDFARAPIAACAALALTMSAAVVGAQSAATDGPQLGPAQPQMAPQAVPFASQPNSNGLQAVAARAMQMADHAAILAQRGMLYSARTELTQALQLVAQALDVQQATGSHAAALAAGLTALDEARDFAIGS